MHNITYARTAKQVRHLIRIAKSVETVTVINGSDPIFVEISKAAALRAIADFAPNDTCNAAIYDGTDLVLGH